MEAWQSGLMQRSWKPSRVDSPPWVRISPLPPFLIFFYPVKMKCETWWFKSFLFSNPKNTQGPSETFYNAVSDGLKPLKLPQIPKVLPRHLGIWGIFAKVSAFLIFAVNGICLPITNAEFLLNHVGLFLCRRDRAFCLRAVCCRIICGRVCCIFWAVAKEYCRCFYLGEGRGKRHYDGVSFDDGVVVGQVLNVISFFLGQLSVAQGNLSYRKGCMLLHTELFRYGKFALQIRICWPLFIII